MYHSPSWKRRWFIADVERSVNSLLLLFSLHGLALPPSLPFPTFLAFTWPAPPTSGLLWSLQGSLPCCAMPAALSLLCFLYPARHQLPKEGPRLSVMGWRR